MAIVNTVVHDKSKVRIKWDKPTSTYVKHIKVKRGIAGSTWDNATTILDNYDISDEYIHQLTASGNYTFFIKTVSTTGIESRYAVSETLNIKIEPNDITGFSVTKKANDSTVVVLTWDANTEPDFDHYVIKVGSSYATATTLQPNWKSGAKYEHKLSSEGTFTFWVVAVNFSKNQSNPVSKDYTIASVKPQNISNFSAVVLTSDSTKVKLDWDSIADTSDLKYYLVKVGDSTSTWSTATVIARTTNSDYLYTLTSSKTVKFYIKAVNNGGEESVTVATTPLTYYNIIPAQVTGLDAVQVVTIDRRRIRITWNANSETDIARYILKYGNSTSTWDTGSTQLLSAKTTEYTLNLTDAGTYKFFIVAYNNAGKYSSVATITKTFTMEPTAPTTITAIQSPTNKVNGNIAWSAISDADLSHYVLEVSKDGGAYTTALATTKATSYVYTFSSEGSYIFRVKAINLGGKSSTYTTATPLTVNLKPSAPTVPANPVTLNPLDSSRIIVKWNGISDADFLCYELVYGTVWSESAKQTVTSTTWTQELDGGSGTYTFLVRSRNTLGYVSSAVTLSGTVVVEPPNVVWNNPVQSPLDRTKVTLSWIPISTTIKDFSHYVVKVGGTSWSDATSIATTKNTSIVHTLTAADHNVAKKFWIKAVKNAGYESVTANLITPTFLVKPSTPVADKIYVDGKKIIVEWKDTNDLDLANYEIIEGTIWVDDSIVVRTTSRLEFMIENEGDYTFLIRAKSVAGIVSDILTMTILGVKLKPEDVEGFNFTSNPLKRNELTFTWQPADVFVTPDKYVIVKGATWNLTNKIAEVKETTFTYTTTTEGSQTYLIKAVATNGEWSANASAITKTVTLTPATPTAPANAITQSNADCSQITVIWNEVNRTIETDFDHYEVVVGTTWNNTTKQIVSNNKFLHTITTSGLHTFLIKAVAKTGYSSAALSVSKDLSLLPQNVGTITVTQRTDDKRYFTLKWNPVTNGDFRSYKIKKGIETSTWDTATLEQDDLNANNYETYIATETKEKVFVKAVNKLNKESALASSALIDTTSTGTYTFRISAPTNAIATWGGAANRNKVTVAWDKHADLSLSHYEVKKLGILWTDTANVVKTTELSYTFTIPSNSTGAQTYVVRAVSKGGYTSSDVTVVSGSVNMTPTPIDTTTITFTQSTTDRRIYTIAWTAPSNSTDPDFDHYEIAWANSTAGIAKTVLSDNLKNNYFTVTAAYASQYTFYIKTYNTLGNVSAENSKTFTPNLTPSAITGLTASNSIATGRDLIIVTWNAHADSDFDRFEVKRSTDTWTNASLTTDPSYKYNATTAGSYSFDVRARNKAGFYSTVATTTPVTVTLEPTTITGLAVSQSTADKRNFTLSWTANADVDFSYYVIKYENLTTPSGLITLTNTQLKTNSIAVTLLTQESYKFYVYAVNKIGVQNTTAGMYTFTPNLTPTFTPTSFVAEWDVAKYGRNKIVVKWSACTDTDLDYYDVKFGADTWDVSVDTKELSVTFNVSSSGTYSFDLRVWNKAGFSSTSVSTSVTVTMEPGSVSSNSITFTQSDTDRRNYKVAWKAIDLTTNPDFDHYEIYREISGVKSPLALNVKNPFYDDILLIQSQHTYYINTVNIHNKRGTEASKPITPNLTPTAPTNLVANINPLKSNEVILTWTKSPDLDIDYYETKLGTETWQYAERIVGVTTTYIFPSSTSGSFSFQLRAKNKAGFVSTELSAASSLKFEPDDVTGFTATVNPADKRNVRLKWNNNTNGDISHYKIKYGASWAAGTEITTQNIVANMYNDYYVYADQTINFWIKAYNKQGKESVNATNATATVTLAPTKPATGSFTASTTNRFEITVSWSAVTDLDLAGYELKYKNTSGVSTVIYTGRETSYKYTIGSANAVDGTHTFEVRSINLSTAATGVYSAVLSIPVTISSRPSNVTGFAASQNVLDRRTLNLTWNTNTDSDFSHYIVKKGSTWETGTDVATNVKVPKLDLGVTTEGAVTYHVKAVNVGGKESSTSASAPITIRLAPYKPATGKIEQDVNDKSILVFKWDASTDKDVSYYEVVQGATTYNVNETFMNFYPTNLNVTSYSFTVKAVTLGNWKSTALSVSATVSFIPSDITGLQVSQSILDHTKVQLEWNVLSDRDIVSYKITRTRDGSAEVKTYSNITTTSYTDTIDNEDTFTWSIIAINKCGKQSAIPATFSSTFNMNPIAPSNVTLTQSTTNRSTCYISFTGINQQDLKEYDIRVGSDWDSATQIVKTKETTNIVWNPPQTGSYTILVKAVNNAGYYSDEASSPSTTVTLEPVPVTNFMAMQNGDSILFTWDKSTDADVISYELREGAQFDNGSIIESGITVISFSLPVDMEITRQFYIKAINISGRYSATASSVVIAINNLPPKNVVNVYQELPEGYFTFNRANYITTTGIPTTSNVLTVEFWMNCITPASAHMIMGFGTSTTTGSNLYYDATTKTFGFNHYNGDTFGISNADTKLFNSWKFVVAEFVSNNTANCKIWIDGVSQTVSQVRGTTTNKVLDSTFTLGRGFPTDGNMYAGNMKKVRIYNRSLTNVEVYDHFQGDYSESDATLIAYWKLNDIEGTVADDRAGVYDGTVTGTAVWGLDVSGTATDVEFGKSNINCSNVGNITGKYFCTDYRDIYGEPNIRCNEIGGEVVMRLKHRNLFSPTRQLLDSVSTYYSSVVTLTQNQTVADWNTTIATRVQTTGGANILVGRLFTDATVNATIGTAYSASVKVKNNGTNAVRVYLNAGGVNSGNVYVNAGETKLVTINNVVATTASAMELRFYNTVAGLSLDFYAFEPQIEVGTVATAFNSYLSSGSYAVMKKDMGQRITANIASHFISTNILAAGSSAVLQFRTSVDEVYWTPWRDFVPILTTFRYIEFRVLLSSVDGATTPEVSLLTDIIDVPDKDKYGISIVPVGGLWIHFDPNSTDASPLNFFYQQPSVVATANEQGKYAVVDESLVSLYRFKVVVYNSSGVDIGGKVMWIAKGY